MTTDSRPREAAKFVAYRWTHTFWGVTLAEFTDGLLTREMTEKRLRERLAANLPIDETARALRNWPPDREAA